VDFVRLGSTFRAIRLDLRLRQLDVAARAGVCQQTVSNVERGDLDRLSIGVLSSVASALGADLAVTLRWRGPRLARLLDRRHAELQDLVAGILSRSGWEVLPEESFNYYGERGSADLLGWRPDRRALLVVEIKSELVDLQETIRTLGVKTRVLPGVLRRSRGWQAGAVAAVLVLPDAHFHRSAVAHHAALLTAALPARTRAVRDWLADPVGDLRGIWFLPNTPPGGTRRKQSGTQRVSRRSGSPRNPQRARSGGDRPDTDAPNGPQRPGRAHPTRPQRF
jgi:transcriptional regulator with XRE-family HTH domain